MAFKYSTGFKNQVLDNGSLKSIFDGGYIRIYTADSVPEEADDALPGDAVRLITYSVDDGGAGLTLASSAEDGTISKNSGELWRGTAVESGQGVFFRYERDSDSGEHSTEEPRIQGTVGPGNSDLFMSNPAFVDGELYSLDYFSITVFGA